MGAVLEVCCSTRQCFDSTKHGLQLPLHPALHPRLPAVEKAEAEAALEEAIPALEEAAAALNDLRKEDITEIRSFAKPHMLVQKVGGRAVRRHAGWPTLGHLRQKGSSMEVHGLLCI